MQLDDIGLQPLCKKQPSPRSYLATDKDIEAAIWQGAVEQQLYLAAAAFLAKESGFDHFSVVEDEMGAFGQKIWKLVKSGVGDGLCRSLIDQEPGAFGWTLGYEMGGEVVVVAASS